MKKKIVSLILIISACAWLCSCSASSALTEEFKNNAITALQSRANANKTIATNLANIGIITTDERDTIISDIDNEVNRLVKEGSDSVAFLGLISDSVSQYTLASTGLPEVLKAKVKDGESDKEIDLKWYGDLSSTDLFDNPVSDCPCGSHHHGGWAYCTKLDNGKLTIEAYTQVCDMRKVDTNATSPVTLSAFVMSNYLHCNTFRSYFNNMGSYSSDYIGKTIYRDNIEHYNNVHTIHYTGSVDIDAQPDPINFIGEHIATQINEEVSKLQVWVLRPDVPDSLECDIDTLIDMIEQHVTKYKSGSDENKSLEDTDVLSNYFTRAIDINAPLMNETGSRREVYMIDPNNTTWNLVGESKEWSKEHDRHAATEYAKLDRCGYDLAVDQHKLKDALHIRTYEFSSDAAKLFELLFSHNEKNDSTYTPRYYVSRNTGAGAINLYLMEYPLEYISEMNNSEDGKSVECSTKLSGLGVNLMAKCFVKYKYDPSSETGWDTSVSTVIEKDTKEGYYLTLDQNKDPNKKESNTSICLNGTTVNKIPIIGMSGKEANKLEDLPNEATITTGRLVLRDYLEATFAPDFQQDSSKSSYGENLIAFGRKIRFNMSKDKWLKEMSVYNINGNMPIKDYHNTYLSYKKSDTDAAYFVNQDGTRVQTSPSLAITEFCDIENLENDNYSDCKLVTLAQDGEEASIDEKDISGVPTISDLSTVVIDNRHKSKSNKDTYITTSEVFPGPNMAKNDFDEDEPDSSKQRFYAIATRSGLLKTSLYSSWINSQSESGSLDWWNGYLTANNFDYTIDKDTVANYINKNYKFAATDSNIVMLDLETIDGIKKIYKEEDIEDKNKVIKTIFVVGGWLMIIYSSILMLLWAIDVNSGLGVPLLQKATFGHWVAIKYEDDIPNGREKGPNGESYMTLKRMLIRVGVILLLSLILIYVNMNWVVLTLIKSFGRLGSSIEKIINGAGI